MPDTTRRERGVVRRAAGANSEECRVGSGDGVAHAQREAACMAQHGVGQQVAGALYV